MNIKNITVKIECIETGEIVKQSDCGTDQVKADKIEMALLKKTDLDKYHVYQSITV